jgi:hypothetical protein
MDSFRIYRVEDVDLGTEDIKQFRVTSTGGWSDTTVVADVLVPYAIDLPSALWNHVMTENSNSTHADPHTQQFEVYASVQEEYRCNIITLHNCTSTRAYYVKRHVGAGQQDGRSIREE